MAEEPRLDGLNGQVLSNIFSRLDKRDLRSIAATCNALQHPAERILFRGVNLGGPTFQRLCDMEPNQGTVIERSDTIRLSWMKPMLLRKEHRIDSVRRVETFIFNSTFHTKYWILTLLVERLRIIHVQTLTATSPTHRPSLEDFASLCTMLGAASELTHLGIHTFAHRLKAGLDHILLSCRKLQHIRLLLEDLPDETAVNDSEDTVLKAVEHFTSTITSLDIDMRTSYSKWIGNMIRHSPHLKQLRLREHQSQSASDWEEVWEIIRCHQELKSLDCRLTEDLESGELVDLDEKDFLSIEGLSLSVDFVPAQEIHSNVNSPFDSLAGVLMLQWASIPPMKSLKRLVLASLEDCNGDRTSIEQRRITQDRVRELLAAPRLEMIQALTICAGLKSPVRDPAQWCRKQITGILIRTYVLGDDVFLHLRLMDLVGSFHVYGDENFHEDLEHYNQIPPDVRDCLGDDHCLSHQWTDITDFNGRYVPVDVLREVYAIEGKDPAWITPERDGELSHRAWEYLKNWRGDEPGREEELGIQENSDMDVDIDAESDDSGDSSAAGTDESH